jgi:hypothetical protein
MPFLLFVNVFNPITNRLESRPAADKKTLWQNLQGAAIGSGIFSTFFWRLQLT